MKQRFFILHKLLECSTIHRRSYAILEPDLPSRYEYVLDCRLTPVQKEMYDYYLENYVFGNLLGEHSEKKNLFLHFCILGFIWNHPVCVWRYFVYNAIVNVSFCRQFFWNTLSSQKIKFLRQKSRRKNSNLMTNLVTAKFQSQVFNLWTP